MKTGYQDIRARDWADRVFVMEQRHLETVIGMCPSCLGKTTVLGVEDVYSRNSAKLRARSYQRPAPTARSEATDTTTSRPRGKISTTRFWWPNRSSDRGASTQNVGQRTQSRRSAVGRRSVRCSTMACAGSGCSWRVQLARPGRCVDSMRPVLRGRLP